MKLKKIVFTLLFCAASYTSLLAQQNLNREILPIVPPEPATYSELTTANLKPPAPFNVTAPKDAPNVVIILIDDLGLGATQLLVAP